MLLRPQSYAQFMQEAQQPQLLDGGQAGRPQDQQSFRLGEFGAGGVLGIDHYFLRYRPMGA